MNTKSLLLARASSQYLSCANQAAFQVTGDMTMEAWINLATLPSGANETYTIFSKYNDSLSQISYLFSVRTDASPTPIVGLGLALSSDGSSSDSFFFTFGLSIVNWYHIAFVYHASTATVDLYFNGVYQSSITKTVTSIFNSNAKFIVSGFREGSVIECFDGKLDELRLWSVARTAAQILANYQRELAGNEANLNAYYKFNNDYTDTTTNGNTLTPSGLPSFSSDVPFADTTTTSTSTTSTSTSTTSTSTSTSTTSTSSSTSTSHTTSTSTTLTITTTSTSTSTTSTSISTTSTSTTSTSTTSTSSTTTVDFRIIVEKIK